jgi:hypothetical protein
MNAPQHDQIRENLLIEGLQDFVALWEVHQGFAGEDPAQAPSLSKVQALTLNLIRELVNEGLVVLGVPDRKEPSGFAQWDLPLETAMAKIEDAYVKNFDDDHNWIYMVWMNLTASGQQLALELYRADDRAT